MAINSILEELGDAVDGSLLADDLVIFITRNQRVATKALQEVTNKLDAWTVERTNLIHKQDSKHDI